MEGLRLGELALPQHGAKAMVKLHESCRGRKGDRDKKSILTTAGEGEVSLIQQWRRV
jgi:hypothetical protein